MADVINIVSNRSYKVYNFFLKVELEGELRLSEFNLFHSINDDGQKRTEEKVIPYFNLENHQVLIISC